MLGLKRRWEQQDKEILLEICIGAMFLTVLIFPYATGMKSLECNKNPMQLFQQCRVVKADTASPVTALPQEDQQEQKG